ncbi:MAG TPA: carbohydrate ABC transporter permease [Ruminiclostridium sp.]
MNIISKTNKLEKQNIFFKIFLWIYFVISLYPIVWMAFYSLKNNDEIFITNPFGFPTHFRVENYLSATKTFNIPVYFFNSIIVSFFTVVGTIAISLLFSYAAARMEWKLKNVARIYMIMGLFIPISVILIPLSKLLRDMHISNTYLAMIIPYIAMNMSFAVLVFYGFLRSIPFELEESAYIDGANVYRTFYSIIVPIIKPAIATVVIFIFLQAWNEFTFAYTLISNQSIKTLPLGLLFFQGKYTTDWGAMGACMTIASFPMVIIYLVFSEQVERAMTVGSAVKG